MRRFRHNHLQIPVFVKRKQQRLRPGNGAEQLQHKVTQAIAISVQRGNNHTIAGAG